MDKQRILIVDDEEDIRDLLEIYLVNEGYDVIKTADGLKAIDALEKEIFDLIILDIMMPKMDGIRGMYENKKG